MATDLSDLDLLESKRASASKRDGVWKRETDAVDSVCIARAKAVDMKPKPNNSVSY